MRLSGLVSTACACAATGVFAGGSPSVTIPHGVIIGTATSVPSATVGVNKYLGIPFAQSPPVRFAPPSNPANWSSPLLATSFKASCLQQFIYPKAYQMAEEAFFEAPLGYPTSESEDCLYLNVYTPDCSPPRGGWPVMFWIHGGALELGTAGVPGLDGSSFAANQGVVMVTTNYRTNVFGFPNSPELPPDQENVGLLDQRKSLEWVSRHIAAFGGNKDKITIFGESAGGWSVKQLLALPPSPLSFAGAIMESEAIQFTSSGPATWQNLTELLGCANASSPLACVRSKPATQIQTIIETEILEFPPVFDNVTALADVREAIKGHTAAQVPFIIGNNGNEGRVFSAESGLNLSTPFIVATLFLDQLFPNATAFQQALIAAYPSWISTNAYLLSSAVITDLIFQCPTAEISNLAARQGYDVWRYYFNATFPNTQLFQDAGAYHTSEITEVFGTYSAKGATPQQVQLSKYMQTAWANFAKDPAGGPGGQWPRVAPHTGLHGLDLAGLGINGSSGDTTLDKKEIDAICKLYKPVIPTL